MDFTSNLRLSSRAPTSVNFQNRNSSFRVVLSSNDLFQYEKSQLSIASITFTKRSNYIGKIFWYTIQNVDEFDMNFFKEADPELTVDISIDVSLTLFHGGGVYMTPSTKNLNCDFSIVFWALKFYDFINNTNIHVETKFELSSTFRLIFEKVKTWNFTIFTYVLHVARFEGPKFESQ